MPGSIYQRSDTRLPDCGLTVPVGPVADPRAVHPGAMTGVIERTELVVVARKALQMWTPG